MKNTPDKIITRDTGEAFYCAECRKRYQKCRCKVYVSVDALKDAKYACLRSKASTP